MNTDFVVVMRSPCLMEDEGRHFFVMGPVSIAIAKAWIADQKDQYFKPGDYYILDAKEKK